MISTDCNILLLIKLIVYKFASKTDLSIIRTFQIGYDKQGLPIGLQLIGRPWSEATLLRLASVIEVYIYISSMNYLREFHQSVIMQTWV